MKDYQKPEIEYVELTTEAITTGEDQGGQTGGGAMSVPPDYWG